MITFYRHCHVFDFRGPWALSCTTHLGWWYLLCTMHSSSYSIFNRNFHPTSICEPMKDALDHEFFNAETIAPWSAVRSMSKKTWCVTTHIRDGPWQPHKEATVTAQKHMLKVTMYLVGLCIYAKHSQPILPMWNWVLTWCPQKCTVSSSWKHSQTKVMLDNFVCLT